MGQTQKDIKDIKESNIVSQPMPKIRTDKLGKEIPYPKNIPSPKKIVEAINNRYYSYSIWEIIGFLIKQGPRIISILVHIVKLMKRIKDMKKQDGKTTFMATVKVILVLLAAVVGLFGLDITPEIQNTLLVFAGGGWVIVDWFQGYFTKDKKEPEKK